MKIIYNPGFRLPSHCRPSNRPKTWLPSSAGHLLLPSHCLCPPRSLLSAWPIVHFSGSCCRTPCLQLLRVKWWAYWHFLARLGPPITFYAPELMTFSKGSCPAGFALASWPARPSSSAQASPSPAYAFIVLLGLFRWNPCIADFFFLLRYSLTVWLPRRF